MQWYDYLFEYGPMFLAVVAAVVMCVRTKNVKYLKEVVNVVRQIIEGDGVVIEESSTAPRVGKYAQSFEGAELVPVYRLNKSTGELEHTGEYKNIQEYIQSFKDIALQAALERFVPQEDKAESELQSCVDDYADWLDEYGAVVDRAYQFADDEGLSDMSVSEIYKAMHAKSEKLKQQLAAIQSKKGEEGGAEDASEKVPRGEASES